MFAPKASKPPGKSVSTNSLAPQHSAVAADCPGQGALEQTALRQYDRKTPQVVTKRMSDSAAMGTVEQHERIPSQNLATACFAFGNIHVFPAGQTVVQQKAI